MLKRTNAELLERPESLQTVLNGSETVPFALGMIELRTGCGVSAREEESRVQ